MDREPQKKTNAPTPLETFEWDSLWVEHTEDAAAERALYIGDSISMGTRPVMNSITGDRLRTDGFASSKALDNPFLIPALRLFASQQTAPYRTVLINNGLHGRHLSDADYAAHYEKTALALRELFPGAELYILLTTQIRDEAWAEEVVRRNAAAAALAEKLGAPTVDLYSPTADGKLLGADGVHFLSEGYELLAKTILGVLGF